MSDQDIAAFEQWAALPYLNLNLMKFPPKDGQVGGRPVYCDPTTEIARAAWCASKSQRPVKSETKRCPKCQGTGYRVTDTYSPRVVDCDFCGAKGNVFIDYEATDKQRRKPKPLSK